MRYYTFTNFMLSSIQQGIQPAHCIHETFVKYERRASEGDILARATLWEWAKNHKTMICLNGGNSQGIRDVYSQLEIFGHQLNLPFCKFHEDEQSLDSVMTCCGIVVPAHIYEAAAVIRGGNEEVDVGLLESEYQLAEFLNQFGLAK